MKLLAFFFALLSFASQCVAASNDVAVTTAVSANTSQSADWWGASPWQPSDRGFLWYPPNEEKAKPPVKPKPEHKDITKITSMDELRKEVVRLREQAVMNPTPANVHEYLAAQAYVMQKAAIFADVARRVVWQNPDVDYNTRSPTAAYAALDKKDEMAAAETRTVTSLAQQDYGLVFFYKSDCPYCHAEAPVLKELQSMYGMPILAVSMDGGGIAEFPDAKPDNGISMQVTGGRGIDVVPALYLLNRRTHQVEAIGSGAIAMDEIVDRIRVLTQTKPGDDF